MLTTAECLRAFMIDRYLKVSDFKNQRCWDIRTAFVYTVAFEGIRTIPVQQLDRAQREEIANRILRILLQTKVPSLATTTDHLDLLAELTTMPNNSMDILTNTFDNGKTRLTRPEGEFALMTLACDIDGFLTWSIEQIDSVAALRRLTWSTMRQVSPPIVWALLPYTDELQLSICNT